MTTEKEMCNTLEGPFETLANKFKLQYNETIKSLQFRKLYKYDDENVEEWMGRLHIAAVECNYQEVDRQLKEHFIHGLNDKYMPEEIIKELIAANNNDHIPSGTVFAWAKRVEALTTKLDTYAGNNNVIILYKIDTWSDGNIMPWYIFKTLFLKVTKSELKKPLKRS